MAEISAIDHNGNLGASYVGKAMKLFGVTSDLWNEWHMGRWAREEYGTAGCDNRLVIRLNLLQRNPALLKRRADTNRACDVVHIKGWPLHRVLSGGRF